MTKSEIIYLEACRKAERNGRIRDRIKAVLLNDKGWSCQQIAEALLIHETTVWSDLSDYSHIIANGGGAHTSQEAALFLCHPNAVSRDYLKKPMALNYPETILS